MQSG
jgi:hypothetical protein